MKITLCFQGRTGDSAESGLARCALPATERAQAPPGQGLGCHSRHNWARGQGLMLTRQHLCGPNTSPGGKIPKPAQFRPFRWTQGVLTQSKCPRALRARRKFYASFISRAVQAAPHHTHDGIKTKMKVGK